MTGPEHRIVPRVSMREVKRRAALPHNAEFMREAGELAFMNVVCGRRKLKPALRMLWAIMLTRINEDMDVLPHDRLLRLFNEAGIEHGLDHKSGPRQKYREDRIGEI